MGFITSRYNEVIDLMAWVPPPKKNRNDLMAWFAPLIISCSRMVWQIVCNFLIKLWPDIVYSLLWQGFTLLLGQANHINFPTYQWREPFLVSLHIEQYL